MLESALWEVQVVAFDVAHDGVVQVLAGAKAGGGQHLADTAMEALDHAMDLRVPGLDQAMVDSVLGADLVAGMVAGGLALSVGKEAV